MLWLPVTSDDARAFHCVFQLMFDDQLLRAIRQPGMLPLPAHPARALFDDANQVRASSSRNLLAAPAAAVGARNRPRAAAGSWPARSTSPDDALPKSRYAAGFRRQRRATPRVLARRSIRRRRRRPTCGRRCRDPDAAPPSHGFCSSQNDATLFRGVDLRWSSAATSSGTTPR